MGIARSLGEAGCGAGTPGFAPPETVNKAPAHKTTDLWTLAALGIWLQTGEVPGWVMEGSERHLTLPVFYPADRFAEALWDLLRSALVPDPLRRPCISEWRRELLTLSRLVAENGIAERVHLVASQSVSLKRSCS
jgi:serine/threonine protein kinase